MKRLFKIASVTALVIGGWSTNAAACDCTFGGLTVGITSEMHFLWPPAANKQNIVTLWVKTTRSVTDNQNCPGRWVDGGSHVTEEEECAEMGGEWDPMQNGGQGGCVLPSSPIILATAKATKYKLTSREEGVVFDIDGDGTPEQVAWTEPDSDVAFLALDRDEDGMITSGKELFGSSTVPGILEGFSALNALNGVRKPALEAGDALYEKLLLWTDRNHNGVSEPNELRPAKEVIAAIGTGFMPHSQKDGHGNLFKYRGWVEIRTAPGKNRSKDAVESESRRRDIHDVFLVCK